MNDDGVTIFHLLVTGGVLSTILTLLYNYLSTRRKFRQILEEKMTLFYDAITAFGYTLSEIQRDELIQIIFNESEPIRKDLRNLLLRREEDEIVRKEQEEARKIMEEQKRASLAAFGEVVTDLELVEKIEQLKTLDEEIDNMLNQYEEWEKGNIGKLGD